MYVPPPPQRKVKFLQNFENLSKKGVHRVNNETGEKYVFKEEGVNRKMDLGTKKDPYTVR
jgi:hypothetical protein